VQLTYQIVAHDHRQEGLDSGTGCGTVVQVCVADTSHIVHS
jgi:hypothetical protein